MHHPSPSSTLYAFILAALVGSLLSSFSFLVLIWLANRRQQKALQGDEAAALKIVLPCYRPLYIFLASVYLLVAVGLALTFVSGPLSVPSQFLVLQYYSLSMLAVYTIVPLLLTQQSVSYLAFKRTSLVIGPWFLLCSLMWGLSAAMPNSLPTKSGDSLQIVFWIVSCLPSLLLSLGILLKVIPSRVQMGSTSNRASVEYMLVFGCFFLGINIASVPQLAAQNAHNLWNLASLLSIFAILWNQLFPLALHRTLLADTKFWRGLGRHNSGGLSYSDGDRTGVAVHKPTVGLAVVADGLQRMMTQIEDITIDFAFLQLQSLIGEGASSKVYSGQHKQQAVAIKVFVPPEITIEVIDEFMKESKLLAELRHENIVRFLGICIRPPQIAMVMELCPMGNLKTSLRKYPTEWKPEWRVRACYDAAKAVEYLHGLGYIHRDLKAENFFIGQGRVVKLGDFGEATKQRKYRPSTHQAVGARMSIVGTVAYMAPELVAATKKYSESIDIYSLGITFWEIWTGREPYDGLNTFQIYDHVSAGKRPEIPQYTTPRFRQLVEMAWSQDEQRRPLAAAIAACLESILLDEFNYRVPTAVDLQGSKTAAAEGGSTDSSDNSPGGRFSRMFNRIGQNLFSGQLASSKKGERPSEGRSTMGTMGGEEEEKKTDLGDIIPDETTGEAEERMDVVVNPMKIHD